MIKRLCTMMLIGLSITSVVLRSRATGRQMTTSSKHQADLILGVLEDIPGDQAGGADFRAVRAIFHKDGAEWRSFPTKCASYLDLKSLPRFYPKGMAWTIAFDGRDLGEVQAETPTEFASYAETGIERITSHGEIPTVGKKSPDYAGFFSTTPVYRPLVAVSKPNFSDPDQWRRAQPSPDRVVTARRQFQNRFSKASNCRNPDENVPRLWKYGDEDIKMNKAYSSRDDRLLIELKLTGWACDGPLGFGDAFDGQWYFVDPQGSVKFLGSDMWLVDAGDYDNDGKSEILFSIRGYDKGGYRIFYQDFSRSAEFVISYH